MSQAGGDGDAAAASAAIERWLAARGAPEPDESALLNLRLSLARICEARLVAADPAAQRILAEMTRADTMEALDAEVDRLGRRVAELTGAGGAPAASPAERGAAAETRRARPSRHLLKL